MNIINSETLISNPLVWLEIQKKNLLYNVQQMKQIIGSAPIMAVVKANAYGLGCAEVAQVIQNEVDALGVVGIPDALALRNAEISKPIINLGIYCTDDSKTYTQNQIRPTIFTQTALCDFDSAAQKENVVGALWIKVDTGLTRLGVPYQDAVEFIKMAMRMKNISVEGVYTTMTEDPTFDLQQRERFQQIKSSCISAGMAIPTWSSSSSQEVFLSPETSIDMVRLGISLLGYYPSPEAKETGRANLKPIATFKSKIACIKKIKNGESLFYRRAFVAKQHTRIAVLLAGYSYGLDPRLVNGGQVLINGNTYPLVGGISATNAFVDIGNTDNICANDEAVLFGNQESSEITVEEICSMLNKNTYEVLSSIPQKVTRIVV